MKALVIRQPWAWAIIEGHKTIENRSWTTRYRGPLAVIAGSSKASLLNGREFIEWLGILVPASLPMGCILGVVNLVDIIRPSQSADAFSEGPWCWVLESPVKLERPVPYKGRLGLFEIGAEALKTESLSATSPNLLAALA